MINVYFQSSEDAKAQSGSSLVRISVGVTVSANYNSGSTQISVEVPAEKVADATRLLREIAVNSAVLAVIDGTNASSALKVSFAEAEDESRREELQQKAVQLEQQLKELLSAS